MKRKLKNFISDTRGAGDEIAFMINAMLLLIVTAICICFLGYVAAELSANQLCRSCVRSVEIGGEYDQVEMNNYIATQMPNAATPITVTSNKTGKIQLRDNFDLTIQTSYSINLLSIGGHTITCPIKTTVRGMSEVYWKDGA